MPDIKLKRRGVAHRTHESHVVRQGRAPVPCDEVPGWLPKNVLQ